MVVAGTAPTILSTLRTENVWRLSTAISLGRRTPVNASAGGQRDAQSRQPLQLTRDQGDGHPLRLSLKIGLDNNCRPRLAELSWRRDDDNITTLQSQRTMSLSSKAINSSGCLR